MERFAVSKTPKGFHVEGFPNAGKLVRVTGPKAQNLSEMGLHRHDLELTLIALNDINASQSNTVREALWHSAIVHYVKCFQKSNSRKPLKASTIWPNGGDPLGIHQYFAHLRNKNVAHDENAYSQCIPGAVINKAGESPKVLHVLGFMAQAETLGQDDWSNLSQLATEAQAHVEREFDRLAKEIGAELETQPHAVLLGMPGLTYNKPTLGDMARPRSRV